MIARAKNALFRYYRVVMQKPSNTKPPKPAVPGARSQRAPLPPRNPNLNGQMRRVLGQHYRAKYGVK